MLRFLFRVIPYRIHISRRLILTSLALVALGAGGARLVDPMTPLAEPQVLFALLWVWGLVLVLNAVAFPAGWIDALFASLALAFLLPASPFFLDYLGTAGKGAQVMSTRMAIFLASALWYTLFSILALGFCRGGPMIRMGRMTVKGHLDSPLCPADLRRALSPAPDTANAVRQCGPIDWTGRFTVSFTATEPDPDGFRLRQSTHCYKARILAETETYKRTEYVLEKDGKSTSSRVEEWFEPEGAGTRYRMQEVHDHFDLPAALGYWLRDFGSDHTRALLDAAGGCRSPAIFTKPQRTAMTSLARLFSWRRAPT